MTNGWRAIPVDYALAVREADDPSPPQDVTPPRPIRIMRPGQQLPLKVWFRNETADARESVVRLVGLGEAIVARPAERIAPRPERFDAEWQQQTFVFQLPERLLPGATLAAVEWLGTKGAADQSAYELLAIGEVPILVDDITAVRLGVEPKLTTGLLSNRLRLTLTNGGPDPVTVSLASYAPGNGWPANLGPAPFEGRKERLSVDFSPPIVELDPGQRCFAECNVRRRARWFGQTKSHVFDISATTASGSVTATSTFRQRAVLPPLLFKVAAIAALVLVAVWLLLRLVTAIVIDTPEDDEWRALPPAEIIARTGHTATWVDFDRPDRGGFAGFTDSLFGGRDRENAVIIWGGETAGGNELADGAIYSDTDDEWTAIAPLNDSEARVGHTAVWTGDQLVVWGGFTRNHQDPNSPDRLATGQFYGAAYEPISGNWLPLPDSGLTPRTGHSMIWTGSALIVFGGVSPDGRVLGDGGILRSGAITTGGDPTNPEIGDLTDGVWSLFQDGQLGSFLNAPRAYHAAVFDGRFMVISGGIGPRSGPSLLNDTYAFDIQRNRWSLLSTPLFEGRACHQMAATAGTIAVLGGLKSTDVVAVIDQPPIPELSDDALLALAPDFCLRPRSIERRDPAPLSLTLKPPDPEPGNPTFEWEPLADAPDYLGANFEAAGTDAGIGVAVPVASLDGIVPIRFTPGKQVAVERLPSTEEVGYRSQFVAAWESTTGRLLVWGGRGPDCGGDGLPATQQPDDESPACLLADGARIDAGI